jgi:hypothetical protein
MPINARDRAVKIVKSILQKSGIDWFSREELEDFIQIHGGITLPTYLNYVKFLKSSGWLTEKDFKFKISKEKFLRDTNE